MFPELPPSGRERRRKRKQKTLVPPPTHQSGWLEWLRAWFDQGSNRSSLDVETWQRRERSPLPTRPPLQPLPTSSPRTNARSSLSRRSNPTVMAWLDVLTLTIWGVLFLKFWLTGKLYLLIHPNYRWLTIGAGVGLLALGLLKCFQQLSHLQSKQGEEKAALASSQQHISLFPAGVSHTLLLVTAILGLVIEPRAFASQTALQRGVTDTLTLTRVKPQAFRSSTRTEDKSIVDWVRTLNVYPEPDAYNGQKVKVQGFVIHPKDLPENYLLISRFVITCCAADVYPVGLLVKLTGSRSTYPPDRWFEVEGEMMTDQPTGNRQLTIRASSLKAIPAPKNPYDF